MSKQLTEEFKDLLRKHRWQSTTIQMTGEHRFWSIDWLPEHNTWTAEQMMRELLGGR